MPKTAMTASPMYFSTVPPCRSSTSFISAKYRDMTSRTVSESIRSARLVEPLRSEKTIVTVFRTSRAGADGTSSAPQKPQSRNRSGFSSPQLGQTSMPRAY